MTQAIPQVKGQTLIDLCNGFLGGYANAIDSNVQLMLLNEGKNEVWMILRELRQDWFMQSSQNTDNTKDNFFGPMSTSVREYPLPNDFHQMKFIEVLDVGFEDVAFIERNMSSAQWKELRRSSTNQAGGSQANLEYHYDIIGKNTLILAENPETNFQNVKLWYVRMIPDFGANDPIDEIVYPYGSKIAMYAAKVLMLALQDQPMYEAWLKEWKDAVARISMSASPRQIADTVYVDAWDGTPEDAIGT